MSEWISVKDRLPPCETDVMVAFTHGVTIGMYEDGTIHTEDSDYCWNECDDLEYCEETDDYIIPKGWWEASRFNPNDEIGQINREVTHWMPLPEPPREVE